MKYLKKILNYLIPSQELTFTEIRLRLAQFLVNDSVLRNSIRWQIQEILRDNGINEGSIRVKASEEIINYLTRKV